MCGKLIFLGLLTVYQQCYFKATAYRVIPHTSKGYVALDGERFPFKDFQVEVLKGLGTLMSPHGHYAVDLLRAAKED